MAAVSGAFLAIFLPLFLQIPAQDPLQALYNEVMATASLDGLPAAVGKLDAAVRRSPSSSFAPHVLETIQVIATLHPGSVPDHQARYEALRTQAEAGGVIAEKLKRLDAFKAYYAAAAEGSGQLAASGLEERSLASALYILQARADAALRAGDYDRAESLARRIIEADPYSPLLAPTYVTLGLCEAYRGRNRNAAKHFQQAIAISPLPTVHGRTQDLLATSFRFTRPVPGQLGGLFDEVSATRLRGGTEIKDPRALLSHDGRFYLLDREQLLTISADGGVVESKQARKIEDFTVAGPGRIYYMADDFVDLGTGGWVKLSRTSGGRSRSLGKLRSIAADRDGAFYVLDQDAGLAHVKPTGGNALEVTPVHPLRGRLLRIDARGLLYVLSWERKAIQVLTRDGKPVGGVAPLPAGGKDPSIEHFALDALGHVYILDTGGDSIQVFSLALQEGTHRAVHVATLMLDSRNHFKNLRVISVAATGEVAVTGKNDDYWVVFR